MKKQLRVFILFFGVLSLKSFSQPFADIVSFNYQTFSTNYQSIPDTKNKTDNFFLNFFLPKEFKNGNTLLIRLNSELINTTYWDKSFPELKSARVLKSISMPLGFKFVSKNKKWETVVLGIPKMTFGYENSSAFQVGGIFLQHFVPNSKLKIKAGLYYNREAFGNFYVPLVGIDWKATDRLYFYGILPTNYRVEFSIIKEKLYTGLNYKSLTRSFLINNGIYHDYIRYDEMQAKLFLEGFVYKKFLAFGEIGYSLGESPIYYGGDPKSPRFYGAPFSFTNSSYLLFNIGIAYRVRLDLEKKEIKNE